MVLGFFYKTSTDIAINIVLMNSFGSDNHVVDICIVTALVQTDSPHSFEMRQSFQATRALKTVYCYTFTNTITEMIYKSTLIFFQICSIFLVFCITQLFRQAFL